LRPCVDVIITGTSQRKKTAMPMIAKVAPFGVRIPRTARRTIARAWRRRRSRSDLSIR
jgi:hypothetical protein